MERTITWNGTEYPVVVSKDNEGYWNVEVCDPTSKRPFAGVGGYLKRTDAMRRFQTWILETPGTEYRNWRL